MIPGGENFLSLDDDSVAWLLTRSGRATQVQVQALCRVVRHIGSEHWTCATAVSDNKQLRLLISCDMIVIRSAVVFGLFFSGEQKSNNIVVYYSCRYVVVDTSYKNKTNSIIVLLWPYNRMVRLTVRLFIMFPCVVNMEF